MEEIETNAVILPKEQKAKFTHISGSSSCGQNLELSQIFARLYELFLQDIETTKEWVTPPEDYDEGFHDWIDGEVDEWLLTQSINKQEELDDE